MIYTVVWTEDAENELANLWTTATDQGSMSWAADQIDVALRRDGNVKGESRSGNRRILIVPPLAVLFRVSELD